MPERFNHILADDRLRGFGSTMKKGALAIPPYAILDGLNQEALARIALGIYILYIATNDVFEEGIRLGEFTTLAREYQVRGHDSPVGPIKAGELVGSLRLMRSLGKMSDMEASERAIAVPLDGLKGLANLREMFRQGSEEVDGVVAIKGASHLVTQNRKLFESLGFSLKPQTFGERHDLPNAMAGKLFLTTPVWGFRQLYREGSFRGFVEANHIRLGQTQQAWIRPETLCSEETGIVLESNIQRAEDLLSRLRARNNQS